MILSLKEDLFLNQLISRALLVNIQFVFSFWDLSENGNQKIIQIDIADNNAKTIGTKYLRHQQEVLNNWFERPKNSNEHILPPLSNTLTVKTDNTDTRRIERDPIFWALFVARETIFKMQSM